MDEQTPRANHATPLAGIKVLDLTRVLAGPWCTQQLADYGADVVKIERPGRGDDTRGWGPPWLAGGDESCALSAYFLSANRGKRSVAVDLATAEGQSLVRRLARQADVVIENFKVGGLEAYGLDYATLKGDNPGIVYCSITGFGQDGPYAGRPGYDFLIQGLGGLMSLTGAADEAGGEPTKVGVAVTDLFAGLYAANAILAALLARANSGEGAYIDMALLDVQVGVLANQALNYLTAGQTPQRMGNTHPNIVPYQAFAAADGHLIITVGNDDQFRRLAEALDDPALASDPRFVTNAQRVAHRDVLVARLGDRLKAHSRDAWLARLEAFGVPAGPINSLDQVFADPQVRHRGMQIERILGDGRPMRLVASPVRMNGQRPSSERPPPGLGEHTREVMQGWLGIEESECRTLQRRGVIG
ncbi:CaiB/BaiF CoA transferase family protein [Salinicola halophilus]|uniref:CaiB/BaiF CoA transferase family protein n=1 Tax=Salinicola halophilus TaxID=184065 RepID=UPI000DA1E544|nr:CaiB/BaiF CoA-transferase family protein [Salinicola halophilus]